MSNIKIEPGTDLIKLTLSFHHRQMLRLIAVRGGSIEYRFNSNFQKPPNLPADHPLQKVENQVKVVKESDDSVRKMGEMGLITITPLIGAGEGKNELRLTDIGRNVLDQMGIPVVEGPQRP